MLGNMEKPVKQRHDWNSLNRDDPVYKWGVGLDDFLRFLPALFFYDSVILVYSLIHRLAPEATSVKCTQPHGGEVGLGRPSVLFHALCVLSQRKPPPQTRLRA